MVGAPSSSSESALLQSTLDCADDVIWAVDAESLRVVAFNRAAAEWTRASFGVELALGMSPDDVMRADALAELCRAAYGRAREGDAHSFDAPFGALPFAHVRVTPIREGERVAAITVTCRDTTEQHRAQDTVRQREAFFWKVLEDAADITSVLARDGRRVFISSGVTRVLGFTGAEGLSLAVAESTHPDDRAHVTRTFADLVQVPGGRVQLRFRQRHKDGSYRTVDAVARNALDDPDVAGIVVNLRDVTEQVRLERQFLQAQKLESVGRLAGGVAHDFNNILTIILSCGEALRTAARGKGPLRPDDAEDVVTAAERGRDLTRQLLAFARKDVVRAAPLDLNGVVAGTENMLRRLLGEDVEIVTQLAAALWPVSCDPGQLDQILFNLSVNARDAMPRGGRFTLRTENVAGARLGGEDAVARDWVALIVSDTGTGMAPDVKEHLFEPFFTTKPIGQGTGLGLATVHGLVQQHGGLVRVESEPGRGTSFHLYFPRCEGARPDVSAGVEAPRVTGTETVLLVEDEPGVRQIATRALRDAGYRVLVAVDGADALAQLEAFTLPLHLLVTDVVMPRVDGVTLVRDARRLRPGLRVLFTSGYADDRLTSRKLLDDVEFLPKPFTPALLLLHVRRALDRAER